MFFQLSTPCRFDPIKDVVVHGMHLTFNLIKKDFWLYSWPEMNENAEEINDRDPAVGGLVARGDFKDRRKEVKWTTKRTASG